MNSLHQTLKSLRLNRDLKQKHIAELLDIHVSTYGKIESGEIGLDVEKAKRLAQFYGVTLDELLGDYEENANNMILEPPANYGQKKNSIRLYIEIDNNVDDEKLPRFFQKLQALIQEENEN